MILHDEEEITIVEDFWRILDRLRLTSHAIRIIATHYKVQAEHAES